MSTHTDLDTSKPQSTQIEQLLGLSLGRTIASGLNDHPLGFKVEATFDFDIETFLTQLDTHSTHDIGVVFVNIDEFDRQTDYTSALKSDRLRTTTQLGDAISWRNESGSEFDWDGRPYPERTVVLYRGDPARLNSLERLGGITQSEVRKAITEYAKSHDTFSENQPAVEFWEAIELDFGNRFGLRMVADYTVTALSKSGQEAIEQLGAKLHILGLLPDDKLLSEPGSVDERIRGNADLVSRISSISNADERRLTSSINSASGADKEVFAQTVNRIREYQRGNYSILEELSYDAVSSVLDTSLSGGGGKQRTRRAASEATLDLLFEEENDDELDEVLDEFENDFKESLGKEEEIEIDYGESSRVTISESKNPDAYELVKHFTSDGNLGGIVEGGEDFDEAIADFTGLDTSVYTANEESSTFALLRTYAKEHDEFDSLLDDLDTFLTTRDSLESELDVLYAAPFMGMMAKDDLLEAVWDYLDAYQSLENRMSNKYGLLKEESPMGASELLSEFLLLDTIAVKSDQGIRLFLTPFHPLHLWKFAKLAQEVTSQRDSIAANDDELEFLQSTIHDQPHLLRSIDIRGSKQIPGKHLIQDEELASLPVYVPIEDAAVGSNEKFWNYLTDKFTAILPPAEDHLQLAVVDPIRPGQLLDFIMDAAESGEIRSCSVKFYFVEKTRESILKGSSDIERVSEFFGEGETNREYHVEVNEFNSYDDCLEELNDDPLHLGLINDHSTPVVEEFEREENLRVHPLYVPKIFKYDGFRDKIQIHSSPDGPLFTGYQDLLNALSNRSRDMHNSAVHELDIDEDQINEFLKGTIWTTVSAPVTNTDKFPSKQLISRVRRNERDYGIYSRNKDYFLRTLIRLFNLHPLSIDKDRAENIAKEIVEHERSGLLRLINEETLGSNTPRNAKGLVGAILAIEWLNDDIEEPHLVFSIDDPEIRKWLNLGKIETRADYLVLRLQEDGVSIDVAEVKAHDSPEREYQITESDDGRKIVTGEAIPQLEASTKTLRKILNEDDDLTIPPRRAAFRESVYFELISQDVKHKREWVDGLNQMFMDDSPVNVSPRIISIEMTEPGEAATTTTAYTEGDSTPVTVEEIPRQKIEQLLVRAEAGESETGIDDETNKGSSIEPSDGEDSGPTTEHIANEDENGDTGDDEAPAGEAELVLPDRYETLLYELRKTLTNYNVDFREVPKSEVEVGPNIVRYKVELSSGERQKTLEGLASDLARELALERRPIIHRLPNTTYIAIDIQRTDPEIVRVNDYAEAVDPEEWVLGKLPFIAGVTPTGEPEVSDLHDAPHMLVGGTTGSGKTVFLQSLVLTLLEINGPEAFDVAILDPKSRDFSLFDHLPNLVQDGVITDVEEAYEVFDWLVNEEIPRRDALMDDSLSVDILDHNERLDEADQIKPLVVVIDEYAELLDKMGEQKDEFESLVRRVAQIARAHGIHLVLATQRPSAKIIDTDLRSNLVMRAAFELPKSEDSRIILDESGAEDLGGEGDMLFKESNQLERLQGLFADADDIRDYIQLYQG